MLSPIKTFLTYFTLRACIYITGLLVICGLLIYIYQKKYLSEDRMKVIFLSILTIYSATILYLTVLGRRPLDIYHANYVPFSSIRYIFTNMDKDRIHRKYIDVCSDRFFGKFIKRKIKAVESGSFGVWLFFLHRNTTKMFKYGIL